MRVASVVMKRTAMSTVPEDGAATVNVSCVHPAFGLSQLFGPSAGCACHAPVCAPHCSRRSSFPFWRKITCGPSISGVAFVIIDQRTCPFRRTPRRTSRSR